MSNKMQANLKTLEKELSNLKIETYRYGVIRAQDLPTKFKKQMEDGVLQVRGVRVVFRFFFEDYRVMPVDQTVGVMKVAS